METWLMEAQERNPYRSHSKSRYVELLHYNSLNQGTDCAFYKFYSEMFSVLSSGVHCDLK